MRQIVKGDGNATAADGSTAIVNRVEVNTTTPPDPHAAAAELLDSLSCDSLPAHGPLPPGSRMPWPRNELFVGRAEDLAAIAATLKAGDGSCVVITGPGGAGKSQLAAEALHRFGQFFAGGAFWLSFAEDVATEIARCGDTLDLGECFAEKKPAEQAAAVWRYWQDGLPRLLVFDNCEDPALLADWRPQGGGCRVLVTARRANWPPGINMVARPLRELARHESIALLRSHRPDLAEDEPALDGIAAELGDFPLALHLAGCYLATYRDTDSGKPAEYLDELRRTEPLAHESLAQEEKTPGDHDADVARTFTLSTRQLDPERPKDALARAVFDHAAHFAPGEPIPPWLLARALGRDWSERTEQRRLIDALARLADLGLIERKDGAPVLHRLLAAFARHNAADAAAARTAVEEAVAAAAEEQNESGLPRPLLAWQPHLRHVAEKAANAGSDAAARLSNELGYHLHMIADYAGARDAFQRALAIDEAAFGPDHPEVATDVNNLGRVLQDLGDLPAARDAFRRALAIDEAALGPDHPKVAIRVNNLGAVLHDLGDLPAARDAFERALAIDEAAFGPDHPNVAISVNNLGSVLNDLGDLPAARDALLRALAIDEAAFGPDHPNVAIRVNNLGSVLHHLGDLPAARDAFQRALAIGEAVFGPNHPDVARNLSNLGSVLKDLGELAAARDAFRRALTIRERVFGPDHPHTQIVRTKLSKLPPDPE